MEGWVGLGLLYGCRSSAMHAISRQLWGLLISLWRARVYVIVCVFRSWQRRRSTAGERSLWQWRLQPTHSSRQEPQWDSQRQVRTGHDSAHQRRTFSLLVSQHVTPSFLCTCMYCMRHRWAPVRGALEVLWWWWTHLISVSKRLQQSDSNACSTEAHLGDRLFVVARPRLCLVNDGGL